MTEQIKIKHEEVNVGNGTVTESETLIQTTGHVKSLIDNALTGIVKLTNTLSIARCVIISGDGADGDSALFIRC